MEMKHGILIILMALGYWAAVIAMVAMYGWKAGALMVLACFCSAVAGKLNDMEGKQ